MSAVIISSIIGAIVFGVIGIFTGGPIYNYFFEVISGYPLNSNATLIIVIIIFAIIGFLITPYITIKPLQALGKIIKGATTQSLVAGLIGLVFGLIVAALISIPLRLLPPPIDSILSIVALLGCVYLGVSLLVTRHEDFFTMFKGIQTRQGKDKDGKTRVESERRILVDTSAIIDGRIAEIAKTGFLGGSLVVPRFVLNELQFVSDSADSLRRQRGRRGLEVLAELQENHDVPVIINDIDVEGVREVDERLIILAQQMNCPILTNDFNLNRVADLQGVKILNINDLSNAVKVVLLPGEEFTIEVIQEGKEYQQGVGYLDDGTMVVIENGQKHLNKSIEVTVTKILQTSAGRMIFAKPITEH
jgi:uncharacterized protein YacL